MKVKYDQENEVLNIRLSNKPIEESDSEKAGIILDYESDKNIVGIEVLNASEKMEQPMKVEYEVR